MMLPIKMLRISALIWHFRIYRAAWAMPLRRSFRLRDGISFETGPDAMNVLNNTPLSGAYARIRRAATVNTNPARGLGGSDTSGTAGVNTFNPRQMIMRALIRF